MAERTLAEQLGGSLPEGIEALEEHERRDLADALRDARRRQAKALAEAGEEGLRYVPALLRGAVRKAVGL
jgi:vacuolar-type H+-ATPase subunit H